jgi:hypothetical protein
MKTRKFILLLTALGPAFCQNASAPRKEPTVATQKAIVTAPKPIPGSAEFKTYEDYVEALINWEIEQKVVAAGKDVVLNVAPAPTPGRFQIVFSPTARADTFMLDTQTGKAWQFTRYTDLIGEPQVWLPVPRIDGQADLAVWLSTQTPKK